MHTLYVTATPIGNLEDISMRALRILKEVDLIAAEDTRKTGRLLKRYDITTPMTSYYEHSKITKLNYILDNLEKGDVALVSDAGMPGISDPGYELIVAALDKGVNVVPIPGASAVTSALSVSGLPTDKFMFSGFLPNKAASRRRMLRRLVSEKSTLVMLEAPHRMQAALRDILAILGDRRIAACRELTKLHEEIFRGTVSEALSHFTAPKGEFTLVIEGNREANLAYNKIEIGLRLRDLRLAGKSAKEAAAELAAETGLTRRELYRMWLEKN